jgi:DNA-binding response OmpR family regulator
VRRRKILIVEDDRKTVELIRLYLDKDGYRVIAAYSGDKAVDLARSERPDLIVLDLMLPEVDGLEVCRTLRRESDVPIVMLTARTTEQDKLSGLDLGADDYITKPFSPRELMARVRAVLRRVQEIPYPDQQEAAFGELRVDFLRREVTVGGRNANLTAAEFRLLAALATEPGRVFDRADLIDKAFGNYFEGFERTIDVHIANLRRKVEPDPKQPRYIKTVYGVGYKFEDKQ